jgi:hypothetical protein
MPVCNQMVVGVRRYDGVTAQRYGATMVRRCTVIAARLHSALVVWCYIDVAVPVRTMKPNRDAQALAARLQESMNTAVPLPPAGPTPPVSSPSASSQSVVDEPAGGPAAATTSAASGAVVGGASQPSTSRQTTGAGEDPPPAVRDEETRRKAPKKKGKPVTEAVTVRMPKPLLAKYVNAAADRTRKLGKVVSAQAVMLEQLERGP